MPLNASSSVVLHLLQNLSLIFLAAFFTPLCFFIAVASTLAGPYLPATKEIKHRRQWRSTSSATFRPKTVLVTGVGMSKGLAIARAFYRAGHTVIGADFEPYRIPVCGRFSVALAKFYRVTKPSPGADGAKRYVEELVNIVKKEQVDLWVSCSGVASAIEDAEAAEAVEKLTDCIPIQFNVEITETLHEKHSFIESTRQIGLNVPETHTIMSIDDALTVLHYEKAGLDKQKTKFIMKYVGTDDSIRANMTLLPLHSIAATRTHLTRLAPSPSRPFVLQQYISGPEFCTHSIVLRGQVVAFTACPSSELLMHYRALPSTSALFRAMQKYTQTYASKVGAGMTGHFSIDFLLEKGQALAEEQDVDTLMTQLYPIECNPRAHTAVVLFHEQAEDMAEAYLRVLPSYRGAGVAGYSTPEIVTTDARAPAYYWIADDLVSKVVLPLLSFLTLRMSFADAVTEVSSFVEHLLFWRDGCYEIWDAWPAFWLYCGYWPLVFVMRILTRTWWSRCNVSTTKLFNC